MKMIKFLLLPLLLFAGASGAWAHGRVGVGVYFGPYWGPAPWYYYPPPPRYYYPPEVIVVPPPEPTVYIEQAPVVQQGEVPPPPPQQYWYYCAQSQAYYPAVKECPAGWQKVLPRPEK